ncbi:MAG: RHS repeat-associated core domain-containing protein [Acidobacteriota bacterium]
MVGVSKSLTRADDDAGRTITTQSDQVFSGDSVLSAITVYDGLGRTTETRTAVPEGTIYTKQEFDAMGRAKRSYNPYRTMSDGTYGYADTAYDALGRVTTVTTADTAVVTTTYLANTTTVTDQAGKKRRSVTDGLDRLIRVDEPDSSGNLDDTANPPQPLQSTSYAYDVLDDLVTVTQGTQSSRSFLYDSLKRLADATNPESGHVQYTYDNNGNLQTKTDARSITTTYAYDALNRVTSRTYSNDTPAVSYKYDSQSLPTGAPSYTRGSSTGRLVAVTYGGTSAGSYQGYDQLGRVNLSYQQTDSQDYGFSYVYNLASEMTSETYPSGRVVQTEYDTGGRIAGLKNQGGTSYYAGATASDDTNRIQYAAHGPISAMKLGNGKWEHATFNNRLQPTQIGLGTSGTDSSILKLDYGYGTTSNNGNLLSQTITAPGLTLTQCYSYDSLNRLSTADEHSGTTCAGSQQWKQAFTYDRFGNRNFDVVNTTGNVLGPNPTISQSTNRIAGGQNYGYDNAGNLTSDPTTPVNGIVYDAENRQTQYTKTGQVTNYYYYDGDGHRVKKIDSSRTTVFVYNAGGQLIAEYTSGTPSGGGTSYLTSDHLGSTRVVMKSDGTTPRHDYLPFGEEIQAGVGSRTAGQGYVADTVRQKFTQKERDTESGLDYFLARYYSSAQGRFTSPDEFTGGPDDLFDFADSASANPTFYADLTNPQSLNKYQYCLNNPLRYIDPDGHDPDDGDNGVVSGAISFLKGVGSGAANVVVGTAKLVKDSIVGCASCVMNTVVDQAKAIGSTLKADFDIVTHPKQAAEAISSAVKEGGTDKALNILGNATGEVLTSLAVAKGAKAVGGAAASTKVVKLQGAKEVIGQRMVVNTKTGSAFQLHKPHHGKGIHLQEMKVVPHPKKPGAFRITDRNVKSTTIIPMKDRP